VLSGLSINALRHYDEIGPLKQLRVSSRAARADG